MAGEPNPSEFVFENGTPIGWYEPLPREWTQFGYDLASTGYNPDSPPVENGSVKWSVATTDAYNYGAPVGEDNTLYFGSDSGVIALSTEDGSEKWYHSTYDQQDENLAKEDGAIYLGDYYYDGEFLAVEESDGSKRWETQTPNRIGAGPKVVDGTVYAGDEDSNVYSFNTTDGTKEWETDLGGQYGVQPPAYHDGVIYFPEFDSQKLYALDADTGNIKWSTANVGDEFDAGAMYNQDDGLVYAPAHDTMYAFNKSDGSQAWSFTTGPAQYGNALDGKPSYYDGKIYFTSKDYNVYCLNASDGSSVWSYSIGAETSASPALAGGEVYIAGDDGNVYAFDAADGSNLWTLSLADVELRIQPIIFGGVLYQALPITDEPDFYAIE